MVGLANEQAVLTVAGVNFQDWESVMVRHELYGTPAYTFRFTCSEGLPLAQNMALLRIQPGDTCTITLAGQLAFTGFVSTRQVFYDAFRHYIEIRGGSAEGSLSNTSVVNKTMQFKGQPQQIISSILAPTGIPFVTEGGALPSTNIPRYAVAHGTSHYEAVDTLLRQLGSFPLTSNVMGALVACIGPNGGGDALVEGVNIIEGREVIFSAQLQNAGSVPAMAQPPGTDDKRGADITHQPFVSQGAIGLIAGVGQLSKTTIGEQPGWTDELLRNRSTATRNWLAEDSVNLTITVYGWQKKSGALWERNETIPVISPMLLMKGSENLTCKAVTFLQDNQIGTRTIIEVANPLGISGITPGISGPSG